jgi:hypothetical protein
MQPLDVVLYGPFKNAMRYLLSRLFHVPKDPSVTLSANLSASEVRVLHNSMYKITREQIVKIATAAQHKVFTATNVVKSFEACGIWPRNPHAHDEKLKQVCGAEAIAAALAEEEGNGDVEADDEMRVPAAADDDDEMKEPQVAAHVPAAAADDDEMKEQQVAAAPAAARQEKKNEEHGEQKKNPQVAGRAPPAPHPAARASERNNQDADGDDDMKAASPATPPRSWKEVTEACEKSGISPDSFLLLLQNLSPASTAAKPTLQQLLPVPRPLGACKPKRIDGGQIMTGLQFEQKVREEEKQKEEKEAEKAKRKQAREEKKVQTQKLKEEKEAKAKKRKDEKDAKAKQKLEEQEAKAKKNTSTRKRKKRTEESNAEIEEAEHKPKRIKDSLKPPPAAVEPVHPPPPAAAVESVHADFLIIRVKRKKLKKTD